MDEGGTRKDALVVMTGKVLQGGAYLFLSKAIGIPVSLLGAVLVMYLVSQGEYGKFVAISGLMLYVTTVLQFGVDVYLVRREGEECPRAHAVANTLLGATGVVAAGVLVALRGVIEHATGLDGLAEAAVPFFALIPLELLVIVPRARLERQLEFKKVAVAERASQIVYYACAIVLGAMGWGVWGLAVATCVMDVCNMVAYSVLARHVPRFGWDRRIARDMAVFGIGYSGAITASQARLLVNPLIVAPALGADAVAVGGVLLNMTEMLSLPREVVRRMSISVLSKFQNDTQRMRRAISQGMGMLVVTLGFSYLAFAHIGQFLLPLVVRPGYLRILDIFPVVASGFLAAYAFTLHQASLHALKRNVAVIAYYLVYDALLFAWAAFLVPRFGLDGYALCFCGAAPAVVVLHAMVARQMGAPEYGSAFVWMASFVPALLVGRTLPVVDVYVGPWAALSLLVPCLHAPSRAVLVGAISMLGEYLRGRAREARPPAEAATAAAATHGCEVQQ